MKKKMIMVVLMILMTAINKRPYKNKTVNRITHKPYKNKTVNRITHKPYKNKTVYRITHKPYKNKTVNCITHKPYKNKTVNRITHRPFKNKNMYVPSSICNTIPSIISLSDNGRGSEGCSLAIVHFVGLPGLVC